MAVDKQNQQNIKDTATYIEDTLKSVASNIGTALKDAVNAAFDEKNATVLSSVGKDFSRSMMAAARSSEDLVRNSSRLQQGLLTSKDVNKQLQQQGERILEIERRKEYLTRLINDSKGLINNRELKSLETALKQAVQAEAALKIQGKILQDDLKSTKEVEKKLGLTGKLVSALGKIPGLGQFINADEIEQEMRKTANSAKGTFSAMGTAASMVGKQLLTGLLDPAFIITKIVTNFLEVNKAAVEYQRLTGQNATVIAGQNTQLATSIQVLELMANITKQTGLAAGAIFSNEDLGRLAEAKNLLGLSSEQAGNLGIRSKLVGTSIDSYEESIVKSVNNFNGLNNTAISHGVVMQDVLNTSEDITLSLGNSGSRLAEADAAARKLGMSLQDVDRIAGKLLDFESSIGSELEAQLLTGKDINLSKAREYTLSNNLKGLSDELAKNGASAAEFAGMNRLAQESLAQALGMSRQELAKSIMLQESAKGLSDEQRANAIGVTVEQLKQMDVQQKLETSLTKFAQAFAPILDALTPIVNVAASITTWLAGAVSFLSPLIAGFTTIYGLFKLWEISTAVITGMQVAQRAAALGYNGILIARQAILNGELAKAIGIAAAWAIANPLQALLGLGVAAGIGALVYSQMKDGVIDPKKGPVVSGEFGTVQLNPRDQIVAGTDLYGKNNKTVGGAKQESSTLSMAAVEAKLDALISVVKQGTNIYLDGKQISRSVNRNLATVTTYTQ